MKIKLIFFSILSFLAIISAFPICSFAQDSSENDKFRISFDDERKLTTVILKGIEIPNNEDSFAVGAAFQYVGKEFANEPCCVQFFLTSLSKKKFKYKENHNLVIWADKEKFDFGKIAWQEPPGGTAFIISGLFYPEEMFIGIERDKFSKIVNASNIKISIGKFKFMLTQEQHNGLKEFVKKMQSVNKVGL